MRGWPGLILRTSAALDPDPAVRGLCRIALGIRDLANGKAPERFRRPGDAGLIFIRPDFEVVRMESGMQPEERPPSVQKIFVARRCGIGRFEKSPETSLRILVGRGNEGGMFRSVILVFSNHGSGVQVTFKLAESFKCSREHFRSFGNFAPFPTSCHATVSRQDIKLFGTGPGIGSLGPESGVWARNRESGPGNFQLSSSDRFHNYIWLRKFGGNLGSALSL